MKQLIHDWRLGSQLLVRLVIACICMAAGAGVLMGLHIALQAMRLSMPYYVFLLLEALYVILFCPLILASYARYCGFAPRTSETRAAQPCKGEM